MPSLTSVPVSMTWLGLPLASVLRSELGSGLTLALGLALGLALAFGFGFGFGFSAHDRRVGHVGDGHGLGFITIRHL